LQIFSNLVANDYKSHVVANGVVRFWLSSTSASSLKKSMHTMLFKGGNEPFNCPTLKPFDYNVVAWLQWII
jgi:hypothetical protein